jgi:hypothetical protein
VGVGWGGRVRGRELQVSRGDKPYCDLLPSLVINLKNKYARDKLDSILPISTSNN